LPITSLKPKNLYNIYTLKINGGGNMVCANIILTLAAILTFLFAVWPGLGGEMVTRWVVGIAAVVVVVVAWTGVKCKYCGK
jgi:hypothetical protein